jgi:hypothetical protein
MYYILADQMTGELIQVSTEPIEQGEFQIVKIREGNIPDLTKYEWHAGSLAFVEKQNIKCMTKEAFTRKLTDIEMITIYTAAKQNIQVEVWLDRFKMAKEICLDDEFMIKGLFSLEQAGLFDPGRASELLEMV